MDRKGNSARETPQGTKIEREKHVKRKWGETEAVKEEMSEFTSYWDRHANI